MVDGVIHETSLCRWKGTPPGPNATEKGLEFFGQSQERALAELRKAFDDKRDADEELRSAQKYHALRFGMKIPRVKLADLAAKWDALPHKSDLSDGRRERVHLVIGRFVRFMNKHFPKVKEAGALTAEHLKAFLADVDASGVSARTWNEHLAVLRSVLAKLDRNSRGFREYLEKLPKRTEHNTHRRPFTGEELEAVFAAAGKMDPELRPVLIAAACTALRRGDVCRLRWDAVDMAEGFATIKTSKTGESVEIPIFPPFMAVLRDAERRRQQGDTYVWPKIAEGYAANPSGLNWRLNKILAAAGFTKPERATGKYHQATSRGELVEAVKAGIATAKWTVRRQKKGLAILQRYLAGQDGKTIAEEMGISRGGISMYLHEMEDLAHVAIVSPPKTPPVRATLEEPQEGEQRKHRGTLCGWHSFRTTFCTLALANGVPMEILRKITGHRTAEIVLKHYDRRGREEMRKAFGAAMPSAIVGVHSI